MTLARHTTRAFSLIELSIVLVILGLLTGGILAGQSLIRASELRAVTAEYQRYITAVQTFRDKYFALPGDFNNATAFWGYTGGTGCTNSSGTAVVTPGTCDGGGNGIMTVAGGAASQSSELFQFWRQLALSGLIEGSYTGIASAGGAYDTTIGTNAPRSKMNNAGWSTYNLANFTAANATTYQSDYQNMLIFGGPVSGNKPNASILKPEEAWNIDTKLDDGLPATGKVIAYNYPSCTTTAAGDNGDKAGTYLLTGTTVTCALYFARAF